MKLYHYTSAALAEGILSSSLSHGHLKRFNGKIITPVVWLTSDPNSEGHGLLTGDEKLTKKDVTYMEKVQGQLKNLTTHNKTQIRITIDIPDDTPTLQSFLEYCKINEDVKFAKIMGLSCYLDFTSISDKKLLRAFKTMKTKESTWWLSWVPLSPNLFTAIDFNDAGTFVPYLFETQGREILLDYGLVVVSPNSLQSLAKFEHASHQFGQVKAVVFCDDPNSKPSVEIRRAGRLLKFHINDQSLINGNLTDDIEEIKSWIRINSTELMNCWGVAVEKYFSYYPEKRTPFAK